MTPAAERYFDELRHLLQAKGVPGSAIDGQLAELVATVTRAGVHPYTEFGDPGDVANRIAGESNSTAPSRPHLWVVSAFALAAVTLIVDGGIGLAQDHSATFGIEPVFVVIIGLAFALLASIPLRYADRWPRYEGPWWTATAIVAGMLAIPATVQIVDRLT